MELKPLNGKELPGETPLWRYMGLGAFFLLLRQNKVFIPSLKKLQEADPKEMRIRRGSVPPMMDSFVDSVLFQKATEWLEKKDRSRPTLVDEWIEQLATRRCAWCWFCPAKPPVNWMESMAMWNLYARNGVAIRTTLGGVTAAFREQDLREVLAAEVQYCLQGVQIPSFGDPEYAKRPFLFKSASYRDEHEIRLVFRVNAAAVESGVKIDVDAKTLLDRGEVIVSPFVVPDEAAAIIEIAKGFLSGVAVTFRASSERSPRPNDPTHSLDWEDELGRRWEPFAREVDLPELLQEL